MIKISRLMEETMVNDCSNLVKLRELTGKLPPISLEDMVYKELGNRIQYKGTEDIHGVGLFIVSE